MTIKSLEEFRSTFGTDAQEVEVKFGKDAAFSVWLRPLTSAARDEYEAGIVGTEGKGRNLANLRARLVAKCWVDGPEGKPIGTAKEIGDMRADAIGAVFEKVRELNGMGSDDAEAVEEAGKD